MLVKYHITFGFILSIILCLIFPNITLIGAGIIFLSSFLIDFDHYVYYVIKKKDMSLKNSIMYFLRRREYMKKMDVKERKEFYSCFCFLTE